MPGLQPIIPVLIGIFAILVILALLPLRLGIVFTCKQGQVSLRALFSLAKIVEWQVNVPIRPARRRATGLPVSARVQGMGWRKRLTGVVTPAEMSEGRRIPESNLHMLLSLVDMVQVILLGKNPADRQGRALGSPLLNLMLGPFVALGKHLCRLEFTWHTAVGVGDPLLTAFCTGALWSLKASVAALLEQRFVTKQPPSIGVHPDFRASGFVTDLRCIFHLSIGQIIWRTIRDAAQNWQGKKAGMYGR